MQQILDYMNAERIAEGKPPYRGLLLIGSMDDYNL